MHAPSSPVRLLGTLAALCSPATAPPAAAQEQVEDQDRTSTQLWVTFQSFKPLNARQWVMHFEAHTNGDQGDDSFSSVDARTRVNFYPRPWLDVFPEIMVRYTREQSDLNSTSAVLRGGVRIRVPGTQQIFDRERVPLQRVDLGILLRLEWRNFFYSDGTHDASWRTRARAEVRVPVNHRSLGVDRTLYLRGDAEMFVPLGEESPETFANRWRFRAGAGYRFSFPWRVEVLGIWQQSRNTLHADFGTTEFMLNLRLRHYFQ